LNTAGISFRFVEITADDEEIRARLRRRENKATEISDARLEDFAKLTAAYERPDASEEYLTIASGPDVEATATTVLRSLICHGN
jgi:uncharacterized protein